MSIFETDLAPPDSNYREEWHPTHIYRGKEVVLQDYKLNGRSVYINRRGIRVPWKNGEKVTKLFPPKEEDLFKSFANSIDLADLLPDEDLWTIKEAEKEKVFEECDQDLPIRLVGLALEALKYTQSIDAQGNSATLKSKDTVRLSIKKTIANGGGCTHFLWKLPETVQAHVTVLEW